MRNALMAELADCTEFRETLRARPPRIVHGTTVLFTTLLVAGLVWAAATDADLVVTAPGVVRPVTATQAAKARIGGRVVKVSFHEGQAVAKGDVLVQLDTEKQDIAIDRRQQTLDAAEEELAKGKALLDSLARQFKAETGAVNAKLDQAAEEVRTAVSRRELDIRQANDDVREAEREDATLRRLIAKQAVTSAEVEKSAAKFREARTKLARAELPVDESKLAVLRQELAQASEAYAVKRQDVEIRQAGKQGEVQAARKDLENLRWEREQACIRAPISGIVLSAEPKEGEIVDAGHVVAEFAGQKGFLFEVQVPSADVDALREGTPARIKLASFDYERYGTQSGTICFVSPDSKVSEPGTATYTVRIELDRDEIGRGDFHGQVKLGMTGQAEIVTRRASVLSLFAKKVRGRIRLE
jgi:multidrug efflux pump subunit AcrA (membrane-fusion protein)